MLGNIHLRIYLPHMVRKEIRIEIRVRNRNKKKYFKKEERGGGLRDRHAKHWITHKQLICLVP